MGRRKNHGREPEEGLTHQDSIVDEALEWFARLRNENPDPATRAAFKRWLALSSRHEQEYRALQAMWDMPAFSKAVDSLPQAPEIRARARARGAIGIATLMATILIAICIWQYPAILLRWEADYLTATGSSSTITLPDGSTMMLDTASAAAVDFSQGKRDIRLLRGAAFFDVKSDPAHPFRVTGSYSQVRVLGTAFSVRSDPEQERVILERGLVHVSHLNDQAGGVDLQHDQMVVATATSLSEVMPADPAVALAWREGRIIFENQLLSSVLNELRRYYSGMIIVADKRVGQLVVTGNYRLDDVEGAISTLADVAGVTMNRLPGGIIILR